MLLHKLCHVSKQWLCSYFIAPGNHSLVCEIDEIQANFRWKWVVYRSANWKQIFLGWELRKSRKKTSKLSLKEEHHEDGSDYSYDFFGEDRY